MTYAFECATCYHLSSQHHLARDGDVVDGPYVCTVCGCAISQASPTLHLTKGEYEQRHPEHAAGRARSRPNVTGVVGPEHRAANNRIVGADERWWKYAVIRGENVPAELNGRWYDLDTMPNFLRRVSGRSVNLEATNMWERRDDGAVAVVYRWLAR